MYTHFHGEHMHLCLRAIVCFIGFYVCSQCHLICDVCVCVSACLYTVWTHVNEFNWFLFSINTNLRKKKMTILSFTISGYDRSLTIHFTFSSGHYTRSGLCLMGVCVCVCVHNYLIWNNVALSHFHTHNTHRHIHWHAGENCNMLRLTPQPSIYAINNCKRKTNWFSRSTSIEIVYLIFFSSLLSCFFFFQCSHCDCVKVINFCRWRIDIAEVVRTTCVFVCIRESFWLRTNANIETVVSSHQADNIYNNNWTILITHCHRCVLDTFSIN